MSVIDFERRLGFSFEACLGCRPVVGYVDTHTIRLYRRVVRHSSGVSLKANLQPAPSGTCISGECGVPAWHIPFIVLSFVLGVAILFDLPVVSLFPWVPWAGVILSAGGAFLAVRRACCDRLFLIGFLRETIKATEGLPEDLATA